MLKVLWLFLKGLVRSNIEKNTDLRVAGREHLIDIADQIQSVRDQRNSLMGFVILDQKQIEEVSEKAESAKKSMRLWAEQGNKEKEEQTYQRYLSEFATLTELQKKEKKGLDEVEVLDARIASLELEASKAQSLINTAATTQQVGHAKTAIEDIHKNITNGPLSGVIQSAELMEATAEATQRERKSKDGSDLLIADKPPALSREEILNG